jgi:hypothetical protein
VLARKPCSVQGNEKSNYLTLRALATLDTVKIYVFWILASGLHFQLALGDGPIAIRELELDAIRRNITAHNAGERCEDINMCF